MQPGLIRCLLIMVIAAGTAAWCRPASAAGATTETILFLRHGEKPQAGLGQLDCQGLNRALALPSVIGRMLGRPDAVFAPDPARAKQDSGRSYDYVRPLATIEPTAIAFGLPVDASIGFADTGALRQALEAPALQGARVIVAWEHILIVTVARDLLAAHGADPAQVPDWPGHDFDSLYVVTLTRSGDQTTARFEHRHEGLDGQPAACPGLQ